MTEKTSVLTSLRLSSPFLLCSFSLFIEIAIQAKWSPVSTSEVWSYLVLSVSNEVTVKGFKWWKLNFYSQEIFKIVVPLKVKKFFYGTFFKWITLILFKNDESSKFSFEFKNRNGFPIKIWIPLPRKSKHVQYGWWIQCAPLKFKEKTKNRIHKPADW